MVAWLSLYALFALTFASLRVSNDGEVYYGFLQRLVGDGSPQAYAYQYGSALFDVPFYLLAWGIRAATPLDSAFGAPLTEVAVAVASNAALLIALYVGWRILVELELPAGPAVLMLALFGSPLFYYTALQPSYKHAVDAMLTTVYAYLLLRLARAPDRRTLVALGACLLWLVSVRYVNIALGVAPLVLLQRPHRLRDLRVLVLATVLAAVVVFGLPLARGIPFHRASQTGAASLREAALFQMPRSLCSEPYLSKPLTFTQCIRNKLGAEIDPGAPAKMLFTVKRGIFLWTPLTLLATIGFVLLLRRRAGPGRFLAALGLAALALLVIHGVWGMFWTGGFSFSQRFLASLFPFFLIGTAELVRRFGRPGIAVLTVCAAFSLFVGLNLFVGWQGISENDGLDRVFRLYTNDERTPIELLKDLGIRARDRLS